MEKKIFICFLFAALLITAGCRKDDTPAEVKTPVGFRAMSQDVLVKSGDVPVRKSLYEYGINTFGVWGISRNDLNVQYLWNQPAANNTVQLVPVTAETVNGEEIYVPAEDGYWFSNSTHDFLALASAEPGTTNTFGTTGLSVTHTNATTGAQSDPVMTFTYDMSSQYDANSYTYDLLGAAARKVVERSIPASQDLIFWHLFSQINISVKFVDANGNDITGNGSTLDKVRLTGVNTRGNYTISYGGTDANPHALNCNVNTHANPTELTFTSAPTLNILPQDISGFSLFLDFKMKVGNVETYMTDFEIDLTPAKKKAEVVLESGQKTSPYIFNNLYNWIISISPKLSVGFTVTVEKWESTPIKDSNNNDEFEII